MLLLVKQHTDNINTCTCKLLQIQQFKWTSGNYLGNYLECSLTSKSTAVLLLVKQHTDNINTCTIRIHVNNSDVICFSVYSQCTVRI